jgi:glyoxylase I family protein
MIVGIHHVAISVDNLEKAVSFYQQAFGFEVVQNSNFKNNKLVDAAIGLTNAEARMAMLKAPNAYIELWQYSHPLPEDRRSRPCDFGYPHFALQVTNIDDEYDRLKATGMTFAGEVVHFNHATAAIYGKDPFGNIIELYEINTPDLPGLTKE